MNDLSSTASELPRYLSRFNYSLADLDANFQNLIKKTKAIVQSLWSWTKLAYFQVDKKVVGVSKFIETILVKITVFLVKMYVTWRPAFIRLAVRSLSAIWILGIAWIISKFFAMPYAGIPVIMACLIFWLVKSE